MIRRAVESDVTQILVIVKNIIDDMKKVDNDQWNEDYPTREIFLNDIKNNILLVYVENGIVVGFLAIVKEKNYLKLLELESANTEEFLVLHRLGIDVNHGRKGIAKALMVESENTAKDLNIKLLYGDTYEINVGMNSLFKTLNYIFLDRVDLHEAREFKYKFNVYKKQLCF